MNLALENDALVIKEERFLDSYKKLMIKTKKIIITCYTLHFINDVLVFIPKRIFDMSSFSIASCVGELIFILFRISFLIHPLKNTDYKIISWN